MSAWVQGRPVENVGADLGPEILTLRAGISDPLLAIVHQRAPGQGFNLFLLNILNSSESFLSAEWIYFLTYRISNTWFLV